MQANNATDNHELQPAQPQSVPSGLLIVPGEFSATHPDPAWPARTPAAAEAIKLYRDQFQTTGYHGTGSYCMWLEEQLLAKNLELDSLTEAIEACSPHLSVEIRAWAGELLAPRAASHG